MKPKKLLELLPKRESNEPGEEQWDIRASLKKAVTTNILPKLLCILAAMFLWFYVVDSESPTHEKTFEGVQIDFGRNANGFQILSSDQVTVDVVLSGKRSVLNRMNNSDIEAFVDIENVSEAGSGKYRINVTTSNETSVESFSPVSVEVYLDETYTCEIPIVAEKRGTVSSSVIIDKVIPKKKMVEVTGPHNVVSSITHAEALVNLDTDIDKSITYADVDLVLYAGGDIVENKYIDMAFDTVSVEVPVYRLKTVPIEPVFKYGFYSEGAYTLSKKEVAVTALVEVIDKITGVHTEVIDETEIENGSYEIALVVDGEWGEDEAMISDSDTCKISVSGGYASKEIILSTQDDLGTFRFRLDDPELEAELSERMTVVVCGRTEDITGLSADDITVEFDCTDLELGENSGCKAKISFASDVKNVYIDPEAEYTGNVFIYESEPEDIGGDVLTEES